MVTPSAARRSAIHGWRPGRCLDFGAGYVQRSIDQFPRQGDDGPWRMTMDYNADVKMLRDGPVEDENLRFTTAGSPAATRELVLTA